jgi:predicted Zn-dependent peptidase
MRAEVRRDSVDGVETFWCEGAGPNIATLTFRIGVVDEALPEKGLTHMVEHLALQPLRLKPYTYNGMVDHLRTSFTVTGEPEEAVEFLRLVCEGVTDLPVSRFEHERQILLNESDRHSLGPIEAMLALRYGPTGPGLLGYPELGLHHLDAEFVVEWARAHFRPENAVLWLTAPPPAGMRLPLLRGGSRKPLPEKKPVVTDLPAWSASRERGIAVSSLCPRSVAATTLCTILADRLQTELRYERALAYETGSAYFPVATETAFAALWADVTRENAAEARDLMVAALDDLAAAGPTGAELERHKEAFRRTHSAEHARAALLDTITQSFLIDPASASRDVAAETEAVTAEDVAGAARELKATAIYELPTRVLMTGGPKRIADWSRNEVTGRKFRPAAGGGDTLFLGDDGITMRQAEGSVTVWFDRCAAMSCWRDGSRVLYGTDGYVMAVLPGAWFEGTKIVEALDDRLAARAVPMTSDPPAAGVIPPPATKAPWDVAFLILGAFLALSAVSVFADPKARAEALPNAVVFFIVGCALAAWGVRLRLRR